jgi:hypothetical protein
LELKSKWRAKWCHEFAQHFGKTGTRDIGAELLFQSWSELSNSAVVAGSDFSDDEDSESSDEDFELRMTTDTDDEDIPMLHAEILEEEEDE